MAPYSNLAMWRTFSAVVNEHKGNATKAKAKATSQVYWSAWKEA